MTPPGQPSTDRAPRRSVGRLALAWASLCILGLFHLVVNLSRHWTPTSDWASIEMRTRDVLSFEHEPVFGAWSRYTWAHPGPVLFYVLAIPYRVLGSDGSDLRTAMLLVNLVVLGLTMWLLGRRGGRAVVVGGSLLMLMLAGLDAHLLTDYWNANAAVLPTVLVLVAAWASLEGDPTGAPVALLAWVWVVQCHLGYGLVTVPAATVAGVTAWRRGERRRLVRPAIVSALAWLPVAFDTLRHWPGNVGRLVRWNLSADEPTVGAATAARGIGRASSLGFLRTWHLPLFDATIGRVGYGVLPFAALVALAVAAWRRRESRRTVGMLGLTWLVGFVAIARIRGEFFWWLATWLAPLAAITWTVLALAALGRRRHGLVVLALGLLGLAAFVGHLDDTRRQPYVNEYWGDVVDQLTDQAWPAYGGVPVFLDFDGEPRAAGAVQAGLVDEWERREGDLRVPTNFAMQMGRHRTADTPADRTRLLLRVEMRNDLPPPAAAVRVAVVSPLSADEQAEQDRLLDDLSAALASAGHGDLIPLLDTKLADVALATATDLEPRRADFERLATLRARGERFALYALAG